MLVVGNLWTPPSGCKISLMNNIFLGLVFLAVSFEVIADILFKYWSIGSRTYLLWLGIILYSAGTVIWAYSLKHEYLSKAITIFTVMNLVAVVLIGVFIFHENLSLTNKLGILLGIASVILVQI